jgi:hypothetical protein|tara:strand:- start:9 stop:785 length:777 start_codon:yes stop_codon:yes gene_type:complete
MASSYSSDLQLEVITTGEKAGLWGSITNDNLKILELAASGYYTVSIAAANLTLNLDNGSALGDTTATGKNLMIEVTGTLAASRIITMPTGAERIFVVKDSTTRSTSNYTIGVQNVGGTGTGIIPLPVGATAAFYTDGTTSNSMKLLGILKPGYVTVTNGSNSPYTAVNGDVIMGVTSSGGGGTIQVTLPATPAAGDEVTIMDTSLTGGFAANLCTVDRNASNILGTGANVTLINNNQSVTLVYTSNATKGWIYKTNTN